ncbi:MAG: signal peptidase I, partial [Thermodesulfobacteriota bacterium]
MIGKSVKRFFFPAVTRHYMARLVCVAVAAFVFFNYICIPFRVQGESMAPTYKTGEINFCFTQRYLFDRPGPPDVVTVRLAGNRVMLLKRIVATEGQSVEFRQGALFVDGKPVDEP